jgi:hypothetical protein
MEVKATTGVLLTLEEYNKLQARIAHLEREQDVWMNVYSNGHYVMWPTKEIAEEHYQTGRAALVHFRVSKGNFVPATFMPEYDSQSDRGTEHG